MLSEALACKITVGVCCMAKKLLSKPMQSIIKHLMEFSELEVIQFDEALIKDAPVEEWPRVDVLISFYSHRFPLDKAIKYVKLVRPYQINDLVA
jgi:hypothetical protein